MVWPSFTGGVYGITEALNAGGEEFGDDRLIETVRAHRDLPFPEMLRKTVETVQEFSGREQMDDLTLVLARAR